MQLLWVNLSLIPLYHLVSLSLYFSFYVLHILHELRIPQKKTIITIQKREMDMRQTSLYHSFTTFKDNLLKNLIMEIPPPNKTALACAIKDILKPLPQWVSTNSCSVMTLALGSYFTVMWSTFFSRVILFIKFVRLILANNINFRWTLYNTTSVYSIIC